MHQVTETTFNDLINRSIAFTHRAIEAARGLGPFTYLDLDHILSGGPAPYNAMTTVTAQLDKRTSADDYDYPALLDNDGNPAHIHTVEEGGYSYQVTKNAVYLRLPLFMLDFVQGFNELLSLLSDPTDPHQLCSYTKPSYDRLQRGGFSPEIQDFSTCYWALSNAPADTASSRQIPELCAHSSYLSCYPQSLYPGGQPADQFRSDQPLWHMREEVRLRFNVYDALPDAVLDALDPDKIKNLFPHLPVKPGNAGMIAYTQSATHGVMDRQTVARAGRFIRQFAKDGTCDEAVKQLTAQVTAHLSSQFKHSNQREDYARVYIQGPSSCMSYDESGKNFGRLLIDGLFVHPAEVYAHPDNDLEIVWMEVNDNVVARTIVNKARMQYPRIYAKESVANAERRLAGYLEDLGYRQNDSALTDQKLLLLSPTKFPDAIICPYIDSSNLGVYVRDDHLLTGGDKTADHETGCLSDYNTNDHDYWTCDSCDEEYDEDEEQYTDYAGDYICDCCRRNSYTEAYCTSPQETRWVPDGHDRLYALTGVSRGPLRYHSYIFVSRDSDLADYDLIKLDDAYYDSDCVALAEDCVSTADGYVLTNDMDHYDLFYNQDEGEACPIRDWAICIDTDGDAELVKVDDIDDECFEHAPNELDDEYPMLKVYTAIAQEEAA